LKVLNFAAAGEIDGGAAGMALAPQAAAVSPRQYQETEVQFLPGVQRALSDLSSLYQKKDLFCG